MGTGIICRTFCGLSLHAVNLKVTATRFLKHDIYLLIEGIRPHETQKGNAAVLTY